MFIMKLKWSYVDEIFNSASRWFSINAITTNANDFT
jgi:hypothetical protein